MTQHYSNPARENDPHALPDVETFYASQIVTIDCLGCGQTDIPWYAEWQWFPSACPLCGRLAEDSWIAKTGNGNDPDAQAYMESPKRGWFYWFCFPGCLPDSDPVGPFATEADALADAREGVEDDDAKSEPESEHLCSSCGEYWPCSVAANPNAYRPLIAATHTPASEK